MLAAAAVLAAGMTNAYAAQSVYLVGKPVGIRMSAGGVVISETAEVITESGTVSPAETAGLCGGDTIRCAQGKSVRSAAELVGAIKSSGGEEIVLLVEHGDGSVFETALTPVYSQSDGCWRAGLWLRDNDSGIGTLSYVLPDGRSFGAVGHPLGESDGIGGTVGEVTLSGIVEGRRGAPGELTGYLGDRVLGSVAANARTGVYGTLERGSTDLLNGCGMYEVAPAASVRTGDAKLLVALPGDDTARLYDVRIEKLSRESRAQDGGARDMVVRVTDDRLLGRAGGIVQGMSGSPIIQDGRFAAVVTHVFISDPQRGYAVYSETMLKNAYYDGIR